MDSDAPNLLSFWQDSEDLAVLPGFREGRSNQVSLVGVDDTILISRFATEFTPF